MAKILVVDDNARNRKLLVALLSHDGHVTLEACDGLEGLEVARAERPQLVISDILLPSMDGYGFVRQLRMDPELRATPVIFHTAHYHEREAHRLAEACRVARVLVKPCPAADMLQTVEQVLVGVAESNAQSRIAGFDRDHLLLITNQLSEQADALAASNARLAALIELNVELAAECDPEVLLEKVCAGARNLLGSRYAVLAVAEKTRNRDLFFATSGIDFGDQPPTPPQITAGPLGAVLAERRPWRVSDVNDHSTHAGLPDDYPAAGAFLVVPLVSPAHAYGWLCLADKVGADGFDAEDERLLTVLGEHFGRTYERAQRYRRLAETRMLHLQSAYVVLNSLESAVAQARSRDVSSEDDSEVRPPIELADGISLALDHIEKAKAADCM